MKFTLITTTDGLAEDLAITSFLRWQLHNVETINDTPRLLKMTRGHIIPVITCNLFEAKGFFDLVKQTEEKGIRLI